MTYNVLIGTLNFTQSLTHFPSLTPLTLTCLVKIGHQAALTPTPCVMYTATDPWEVTHWA